MLVSRLMTNIKTMLWICLLWAPILGIAWYYKGTHQEPLRMNADKINALITQTRMQGRARCIETIRKVLPTSPDVAQDRTDEFLTKCLADE